MSVLSAVGGLKEKAPYLTTGMRKKKELKSHARSDSLYLTNPWIEVEVGTEYLSRINSKVLIHFHTLVLFVSMTSPPTNKLKN